MSIDEAIRAAVRNGCSGFTIWRSGAGWQASVQQHDGGWRVRIDPDPAAALRSALGMVPEPEPDDGGVFG